MTLHAGHDSGGGLFFKKRAALACSCAAYSFGATDLLLGGWRRQSIQICVEKGERSLAKGGREERYVQDFFWECTQWPPLEALCVAFALSCVICWLHLLVEFEPGPAVTVAFNSCGAGMVSGTTSRNKTSMPAVAGQTESWTVQACETLATLLARNPNLSNVRSLLVASEELWVQLEDPKSDMTLILAENEGFDAGYNSGGE
jgi:hypothetical protein